MSMLLDSPGFPPAVIRPTVRAGAPAAAGMAASPTAAGAGAATGPDGAAVGATRPRVGILPVTTLQQAVRIALDRTRRMTLVGAVPGVGPMVLPWLLPLHLLIVGLTADHIRHTPDASLSYSDGTAPRAHHGAVALALLLGPAWFVVLGGAICMLSSHDLDTAAALLLAAASVVPVVEFLSLVEFAALNPEWVKLKKVRGRRSDRRTAFVLTSLVSSRDGCGAARRLMDLTYPQWQAVDAVVIGYPASKSLISYYIRMGARRSDVPGPDGRRPVGRSVTFDCRRPLRVR